jgi:hypothetical protein
LLDRTAAEGIEVDAYIIGGAAMALHLGREELTPDIDGIFHPYEELSRIGALMSAEYGLDPDWVNNNASPFITFDPSDGSNFDEVEVGGHRIRIASKRALLAMKMGRYAIKDFPDITALMKSLQIETPEALVSLTYEVLGTESILLSGDPSDLEVQARDAMRRAYR